MFSFSVITLGDILGFYVRCSLPFLSLGICNVPKRLLMFYLWKQASPLNCVSCLLKTTHVSLRMKCPPRIKTHHLKSSARSHWGPSEDACTRGPAWDTEHFFWVLNDSVFLNLNSCVLLIPTGYLHSISLRTILGLSFTFMRSWLLVWGIVGWFPRIRSGR